MLIIGITGTIGAGKGTVVDYLKQKHAFTHYSAREFIVEEVVRRGLKVDRDSMTAVANDLRREHGPFFIAESLYVRACKQGTPAIIESLRTVGEITFLRELAKISDSTFLLLSVDASLEHRYERVVKRAGVTDHVSFEKFQADNIREMTSTDPNAQNIQACIVLADIPLINDGSIEDLHTEIDQKLNNTPLDIKPE